MDITLVIQLPALWFSERQGRVDTTPIYAVTCIQVCKKHAACFAKKMLGQLLLFLPTTISQANVANCFPLPEFPTGIYGKPCNHPLL